ncbi:hypothetical protein [Streptomyces sp. NPDC093260]|uniref:hypothetical protein n=1 Tax=Streptomyces sp. NPDC093260 TaxID=3155073 RepID=UPI0034258E9E
MFQRTFTKWRRPMAIFKDLYPTRHDDHGDHDDHHGHGHDDHSGHDDDSMRGRRRSHDEDHEFGHHY